MDRAHFRTSQSPAHLPDQACANEIIFEVSAGSCPWHARKQYWDMTRSVDWHFCASGIIQDDFTRHAKLIFVVAAGILARIWLYTTLLILLLAPGWPKTAYYQVVACDRCLGCGPGARACALSSLLLCLSVKQCVRVPTLQVVMVMMCMIGARRHRITPAEGSAPSNLLAVRRMPFCMSA
eukprot:6206794-Pleurochrysis_carterae.AAC.3